MEFVFIDDPVSSLDENHLIELAVNLADLIKSSESDLKFIISTHSVLFYNILHNELDLNKKGRKEGCYLLQHLDDGQFILNTKYGDANTSFFYHLHIAQEIQHAIANNAISRYHFMLLRNLYEKAAGFLGCPKWTELLPDDKDLYAKRVMTFYGHSALATEEVAEPTEPEKRTVKFLFEHLMDSHKFNSFTNQTEKNG